MIYLDDHLAYGEPYLSKQQSLKPKILQYLSWFFWVMLKFKWPKNQLN